MYQTEYDFAPRGWICPKCGRVYSPSTPTCFNCIGNNPPTITSTGTGIPNDKGWWESYLKQTTTGSDKQIVSGSDYQNSTTYTWENVPHTLTNMQKDLNEIKSTFNNTLKGE